MSLDEVKYEIARWNDADRLALLRELRATYNIPIHPLETAWATTAEAILEAIHDSPDLTQRGVRGVLAEATFRTSVVPTLHGWTSIPFTGDLPYDLLLDNGERRIRVQVKLQRREKGLPKLYRAKGVKETPGIYAVETQRTRNGKRGPEGKATRPYRFGEFDVVAVCMQPVHGNWTTFLYCPARALLPRTSDPELIQVMQPVYTDETQGWTSDFTAAARSALTP